MKLGLQRSMARHAVIMATVFGLLSALALLGYRQLTHDPGRLRVTVTQTYPQHGALRVDAEVRLALPDAVRAALSNGVPLVFSVRLQAYDAEARWRPEVVHDVEYRLHIMFHALTDKYLVIRGVDNHYSTHAALPQALLALGALRGMTLLDNADAARHRHLAGRLRVRLARDALPSALQLPARVQADWQLDTDWTHWRLPP